MNEIINIESIKNKIFEIQGQYVMLDSDIAKICGIETKRINEALRNNLNKFNDEHYFLVAKEEIDSFLVENFDQKIEKRGGRYKNPHVFTKAGIELLSTILKSKMQPEIVSKIKAAFHNYEENNYTLITAKKPRNIEKMIHEVRGKQVMLDFDLAALYGCKNGTKTINLAVKRNIKRFPERFMFQLTKEEYHEILRFQIETLELKQGQYAKYLPYAFTEEGVAMLATVLNTSVAEMISVQIMDAFVAMRHYLTNHQEIYKSLNSINNKLREHDAKFDEIFARFDKENPKVLTYYEGEFYDAISRLLNIWKKAQKELIIIDGYADESVLDLISKLEISVILIAKPKANLSKSIIEKYTKQYENLKVYYDDTYHDRYFILDRDMVYHTGASINYAGSRVFSINKWEDKEIRQVFIKNVLQKLETTSKIKN